MSYSLQRIYALPTREVLRDQALVGFLYAPDSLHDDWRVWPDARWTGGLPDGDQGLTPRRFPSEAEALRFLGLAEEARI